MFFYLPWPVDWYGKAENAAFVYLAANPYFPVVQFNKVLTERQPKSQSALTISVFHAHY